MSKKVLVIAAHPDDEVLGVGGTMERHIQQGDQVCVLIMTDGVTARHNETEPQKEASRKACAILGVNTIHFANLPDQRLDELPLLDVIQPISKLINEVQPSVVYTHHRGDANQDHRTVFAATLVAVRPVGNNSVKQVLCYEVGSSTEWGPPFPEWAFIPNVFVDIASALETKVTAMDSYRHTFESEVKLYPHPRSPEAIRIYAQQRGVSVGMHAAEAFMLVRSLIDTAR